MLYSRNPSQIYAGITKYFLFAFKCFAITFHIHNFCVMIWAHLEPPLNLSVPYCCDVRLVYGEPRDEERR